MNEEHKKYMDGVITVSAMMLGHILNSDEHRMDPDVPRAAFEASKYAYALMDSLRRDSRYNPPSVIKQKTLTPPKSPVPQPKFKEVS